MIKLCITSRTKLLIHPGESLTKTITKNMPLGQNCEQEKNRGENQNHFAGKRLPLQPSSSWFGIPGNMVTLPHLGCFSKTNKELWGVSDHQEFLICLRRGG